MPTSEPDPNGPSIAAPSIPGYQITALRGSTSTTNAWDAMQLSLERTVSIITPCAERLSDAAWCDRFEELSRAFARLHHRNFLQVIDTARTADGVPYTVVERLEGDNLATLLHNEGPFAPDRAARIVLQLAEALDNAWKQSGFVMRNLKPENLVLLSGDVVKITAFLYATIVRPGTDPLAADGGALVGTPNYMPPEQIDALHTIDFRADMYAIGAVFLRMLTGHAPFDETRDPMEILRLQKEGTLPAPSDANPAIPPGYSHVLLRMMAKRPADRYPFWQDVVEDLQRILSGRDPFLPSSGGGVWTPPPSTIAPAAPKPVPETPPAAAAAAGAPGKRRITVGGGGRAAPAAPAGRKVIIGRAAGGGQARPSAAPAASASAPAPIPEGKPRIAIGAIQFGGAASAAPADGGTRRSAPVSGGTRRSAPVPEFAPTPTAPQGYAQAQAVGYSDAMAGAPVQPAPAGNTAGRSAVAKGSSALWGKPPPFFVRVAVFVVLLGLFFVVARWRISALDARSAAGSDAASVVSGVPEGVGEPGAEAAVADAAPEAGTYEENNPFAPGAGESPSYDGGDGYFAGSFPGSEPEPAATPTHSLAGSMPGASAPAGADAGAYEENNPFASGSPSSAPATASVEEEPQAKRPLTRFEDVVLDLYETVCTKSFRETYRHAQHSLKTASEQKPDEAGRYQALFAPFRDANACPWEDLVGLTLATAPSERTIVVGGTPFRIVPRRYANGQLVCDRIPERGQPLRDQRLDLTKMDPKDMYAIVREFSVDERTRGALESRALLTLREGTPDEFRRLIKRFPARLSALEPFLNAHRMER